MRAALLTPARPSTLARWRVCFTVELEGREWDCEDRVWGYTSSDAAGRAQANFYADLEAEARRRLTLRVTGVLQEGI